MPGDEHLCHWHGLGNILEGDPYVQADGQPVARLGDDASCGSEISVLVTGSATVEISGKPVARLGEISSHTGMVITGSSTVVIGGPSTLATIQTALGTLVIVPHGGAEPLTGNMVTYDEYMRIVAESELPNRDWGIGDVISWKAPEWLGGGDSHLYSYKDDWVRDHAMSITLAARMYDLPPELVAGTAWIEVGGDPTFIDGVAHVVRSFDHMADPLIEPLTITSRPELTSAGDVSIQIRRAAEILGLDPDNLSYADRNQILNELANDQTNLAIVAAHLRQLANIDFPGAEIGDDEVRVIGARYNRGPDLTIDEIRENTSYGDLIADKWDSLTSLLSQGTGPGSHFSTLIPANEALAQALGGYPVARGP